MLGIWLPLGKWFYICLAQIPGLCSIRDGVRSSCSLTLSRTHRTTVQHLCCHFLNWDIHKLYTSIHKFNTPIHRYTKLFSDTTTNVAISCTDILYTSTLIIHTLYTDMVSLVLGDIFAQMYVKLCNGSVGNFLFLFSISTKMFFLDLKPVGLVYLRDIFLLQYGWLRCWKNSIGICLQIFDVLNMGRLTKNRQINKKWQHFPKITHIGQRICP